MLGTLLQFYSNFLIKAANPEIQTDEVVIGLMIEICAHSNDAEKAVTFFENLESKGFHQTCLPYNAIIKALASRSDYCEKVSALFF